jgi:ABC-type molybdate transport system substrate-binding protein
MIRFAWSFWVAVGTSLVVAGVLVALLMQQAQPPGPKAGTELKLYCAAGMVKPVDEARKEYERLYGVRVHVDYGPSGDLLGKLANLDLPGDLYLAAEHEYIDEALAANLVDEVMPVAPLTPVIAVRPGNPKKIAGLTDLLRPDVTVSLANDKAAIGKVTKRVLTQLRLWDQVNARVEKGGVSMRGTVVEAGADVSKVKVADAAVVWDATALQQGLEVVRDPALEKARDEATLGVLRRSQHPTEALRFARFLTARDRGGELFAKHKFARLPDADKWAVSPEVVVYAGAMLRPAIDGTLRRFAEREGVDLKTVYNGCGILKASIEKEAKVDVYFACDTAFLDPVQRLFEPGRVFSRNPLVIITPKASKYRVESLEDLLQPGVKVGLADPKKSALGEVARRLLQRRKLYDQLVASGHIEAEAATGDWLVNQTRTGALHAAIVYRSNALATPRNVAEHLNVIELGNEVEAVQPFTIARNTEYKYLARRLEAALATAASRRQFQELGFTWAHDERREAN